MRLEALVTDYNKAVEAEMRRTRLQTVFLLVPAAVGIGIDQVFGGWAGTILGAGAGIAIDKIKVRFPTLSGTAAVRAIIREAQFPACSASSDRNDCRHESGLIC